MSSSMISNSSVSDADRTTPNRSQDVDISDKPKGFKNIGCNYRKFVKAGNYR